MRGPWEDPLGAKLWAPSGSSLSNSTCTPRDDLQQPARSGCRFALIQQRLAARLASAAGVRTLPCPFPVTPLVEALWWHPVYERDAGHRWFRGIFEQVRGLLAEAS